MFQPSKAAEEWADAQTEAPNETTLMRACAAGAGLPGGSGCAPTPDRSTA